MYAHDVGLRSLLKHIHSWHFEYTSVLRVLKWRSSAFRRTKATLGDSKYVFLQKRVETIGGICPGLVDPVKLHGLAIAVAIWVRMSFICRRLWVVVGASCR